MTITSGDVNAQGNITSRDIITGLKIDNLTVVQLSLAALTERADQPGCLFRPGPEGGVEVAGGQAPVLLLPANLLEALRLLPRAVDLPAAERHRYYAAWLLTHQHALTPQEMAARHHYIPLGGWLNLQDLPLTLQFTERLILGQGPERREERRRLADVTEAIHSHSALVLLGSPGSGKSTVLRRVAHDAARAHLAGQDDRLPLRLNLAHYRSADTPLEFVSRVWHSERLPDDFVSLVQAGQVLLLADGLNEMERLADSGQARRAAAWRDFIKTTFGDPANHSRLVVASRDQADYSDPLDLPRVEIEPLDEGQIEAFLRAYLGDQAETAMVALKRLALWPHAHNPYQLSVLAALYHQWGEALPRNRGALFAAYGYWLIEREKEVGHSHWIRPEAQRLALAELGYRLQERGESQVVAVDQLLALLPATVRLGRQRIAIDPDDQLDLACRAGILVADTAGGELPDRESYKFSHQLLQEQFAAQHLLARWQAGETATQPWRAARLPEEMPPAHEPASSGDGWEPLPPPPATGWEQTTILAAGLTPQPDTWLRAVLAVNPALAGRCLVEGGAQVSPETRAAVQQALLADLGNPTLHRRTRIQAGRVLAQVGDPRFQPVEVAGVPVILPDLVEIAGGVATLGSADEQAFDREQPVHQVEVAPFYLGRWPVTNAEYGCFIQAGGYDEERYWTAAGWQWRQRKLEMSGAVENIMEIYQALVQNPELIDQALSEGRVTQDWAESWRGLIELPEERVKALAVEQYGQRRTDQPFYWDDPAYNGSNQPVVGVTWYEALAYCAWLEERLKEWINSDASAGDVTLNEVKGLLSQRRDTGSANRGQNLEVCLPTEAEWEWAMGGPQHRTYPWGDDFDPDKANTLEGRVLGATPVGAYPGGAAESGALDLAGNVYEWTSSLYRSYPYLKADGREAMEAEGRRVMRGGSWDLNQRYARVSSRFNPHPDDFYRDDSFRVVVAPV